MVRGWWSCIRATSPKLTIFSLMENGNDPSKMCVWKGTLMLGSETDHHLVTAMVQLKLLRSRRTTCHQGWFHISKLKKVETRKQFYIEIRNRFETLAGASETTHEGSTQAEWDRIIKIYHAAATSTIGFKQKYHKEWLSVDTWEAIAERVKEQRVSL